MGEISKPPKAHHAGGPQVGAISRPPKAHPAGDGEPILGIDLGTSKACVGAVDQQGTLRLISDPDGRSIIPAVISFAPDGSVLVGEEAAARRLVDPQNTITFDFWPDSPTVNTRAGAVSSIDVGSILLDHMRRVANNALGCDSRRVVLTVPEAYDDGQRQLLITAAARAGLGVEELLSCPVGVGYAYGLNEQPLRFVVCDFGASKFECSVLCVRGGRLEVVGSCCDLNLGGIHINHQLLGWMVASFAAANGFDLRHEPVAMTRLATAAERTKRQMWSLGDHGLEVHIPDLCRDGHGRTLSLDLRANADLFRPRLEELVERATRICDEALRRAEIGAHEVTQVLLVGGSCRIPLVRSRLRDHFGTEPRMDVDPETGTALGAALAATRRQPINRRVTARYGSVAAPPDENAAPPSVRPATRIGRVVTKRRFTAISDAQVADPIASFTPPRPTLTEVIAARLALSTVGGFCDEIISADQPIPTSRTRVFSTGRDEQREVHVKVCQGDSRRFDENLPLGSIVLDQLPPRPRGQVRIAVTFAIDSDGVLEASARDEESGQEQSVRIQLPR